jgi:hypothetical protein
MVFVDDNYLFRALPEDYIYQYDKLVTGIFEKVRYSFIVA